MKKIWIRVLFVCLAIFSLALTTYAWIIPDKDVNGFDAYTDGVTFDFKISESTNTTEVFRVSNIVFFDADATDNKNEVDALAACFVEVELVISNTCMNKIEVKLSQINLDKSKPYVACFFSNTKLESFDSQTYKSVQAVIDKYQEGSITIDASSENQIITGKIYMYVIGVQPDDNANNDFLNANDGTYTFTVKMSAEGVN